MKRFWLLIVAGLICLLVGGSAYSGYYYSHVETAAPITFDAAAEDIDSGSTTATWEHVVGAGSNKLLVVGADWWDGDVETITGVTWNTTENFTRLGGATSGSNNGTDLWYLKNPTSATANIVVTWSGTISDIACGSSSWFNVNQTTPMDSFNSATGSGASPSVVISSSTGDVVHDVLGYYRDTESSVGANQTERWNSYAPGEADNCAGSTEPGGASITMSWTTAANDAWRIIGGSINQL